MIQILYGCEAYKMDFIKENLLKDVNAFNKKYFYEISEEISSFLEEETLLGGRRVAVVTLTDLSELDSKLYTKLAEKYKDSDNCIIFCSQSADKRKKFVKELLKGPFMKECTRCRTEPELAKIIRYEAKKAGVTFEPAAERLFIERSGYLMDESINLYHIKNMILDLGESSGDGIITENAVINHIPENILINAFSLTNLIDKGKMDEVKKQAGKMSDGSAISAISAMLYDFRTTYKIKLGMNSKEVGVFKESPFLKYSTAQLLDCINICCNTIEKIKCGEIPEKDALMYACLEITKIIK